MNLKRTLLLTALAIATVIGGASGTQAASVTYTSSTFTGVTPYTQNLSVTKFDTSLGTLTGISITVSSQASADIGVVNNTGTDLAFSNASASSQVTVSTTVGTATSVDVTASTANVSGTATANTTTTVAGPLGSLVTSGAAIIAAADFGNYEGSGSGTVDLKVDAGVGNYSGSGVSGLFFGGSTTVASFVTVTYDYTPVAAVPEPTSSAMFGIGIVLAVGLGWGRRRRELRKFAV
jgi:hypothetical protein